MFFWFVDVGCLFVCLSIHQNDQKVKQIILVKSELAKEQELSTGVLGYSFPQSPRTPVASATNAAPPPTPFQFPPGVFRIQNQINHRLFLQPDWLASTKLYRVRLPRDTCIWMEVSKRPHCLQNPKECGCDA